MTLLDANMTGVQNSSMRLSSKALRVISPPIPLMSPMEIPTRMLFFVFMYNIYVNFIKGIIRGRFYIPYFYLAKLTNKYERMFTGIIEELGTVTNLVPEKDNLHISIKSSITSELKIDQSVSHNGVCLTVVSLDGEEYT